MSIQVYSLITICHQDFGQLMKDNTLVPNPVDRTKILTVHPLQKGCTCIHSQRAECVIWFIAVDNLERHTRHWPMVFNDTVVFSMAQVDHTLHCYTEIITCLL